MNSQCDNCNKIHHDDCVCFACSSCGDCLSCNGQSEDADMCPQCYIDSMSYEDGEEKF